jgi:molecular chaperone GrpE
MQDCKIERVETLGQPFDGHTMNAIGTLETTDQPPGCVAEQLSPGYVWEGRLLRFADVRVSAALPVDNMVSTDRDAPASDD